MTPDQSTNSICLLEDHTRLMLHLRSKFNCRHNDEGSTPYSTLYDHQVMLSRVQILLGLVGARLGMLLLSQVSGLSVNMSETWMDPNGPEPVRCQLLMRWFATITAGQNEAKGKWTAWNRKVGMFFADIRKKFKENEYKEVKSTGTSAVYYQAIKLLSSIVAAS